MDLPKHYTLKKDEEDHFELHDSRDGVSFKVAKKPLHPANQVKILRMKKFSEGGDVYSDQPELGSWGRMDENKTGGELAGLLEESEASKQQQAQRDLRFQDQQAIYGSQQAPTPSMAPLQQETPHPMQQMQAPQQQAPQAQASTQPAAPNPMAGFPTVQSLNAQQGAYEGAIRRGAQGQIEQNRQAADLYEKKINVQEEAQVHYQEAMKRYQENAERLSQDIMDTKIDPQRFWDSKSEGSKWGTAIGVLMSGLGAGMQGTTQNMAMEFINKSIDRDIDSQKANLGKKQTLLSDNFRAQGNMIAAEAATRAQYESMFQGKLAQLAAKTSDPMIKEAAAQKILESQQRGMQFMQPVAQNQMIMQVRDSLRRAHEGGQKIDADPESYIPILVPESHQAAAFKEVGDAKNIKMASIKTLAAFDKAMQEIKSAKTMFGVFTPGASQQIIANITPTVQDLEGSVRMAVMDYVKEAFKPGVINNMLGRAAEQRQALADYLTAKSSAPVSKGFGIDLQDFQSTAKNPAGVGGGGIMEGQTASNAKGQRIQYRNGQWVPLGR